MDASPCSIGRRVVVTGSAGSGKSTLALAIAAKTGQPVIHLDLHFWRPGWVAPSQEEWRATQRDVLAGDEWIADGNYHETLDLRLQLADSVVVLDMPRWVCSVRALRRGFRMPGELPPGCEFSSWTRLRDEWRLAARVVRTARAEHEIEREVISRHRSRLIVHRLRSKEEVSDLLDRLVAPG